MWMALGAAGLFVVAVIAGSPSRPSDAELKRVAGDIVNHCFDRYAGNSSQAARCVDEMGGAYVQGVNGRR